MQTIDIYRSDDLLTSIKVEDGSTQNKKVMGENEVRLQFVLNNYIDFTLNDYTTVFGERYILNKPPIVTKKGKYSYEYSAVLIAEGFLLSRAQFLFLGSDNILKESDFSLMGMAEDFLDLVIQNANRVSSGWIKGQVIIAGYKNITFSMENCYNALGRISEAFSTEFFIEGKIIHLTKRQRVTSHSFRLGKNRGLYDIKRTAFDDSNVITRLYVYGSEKNLPADYRWPTHQEIIESVPVPLPRIPSTRLLMSKGQYFIENNIAKYGVIEYTQIFEDIYPTRTGTVLSVNNSDIYEFFDSTMDFDLNAQLLPGVKAKITFNTGQLAGYTFDIEGYNATTKKFRILKNKDEQVRDIPSAELKPEIGDKYVLTDINMPLIYLLVAEAKLKAAAIAMLAANSEPLLSYQVNLDPVYIDINNIDLNIGDMVGLTDIELNISRPIRIISTTRNIVNESDIKIELSDTVAISPFTQVVTGVQSNSRDIDQIGRQLQNTFNGKMVGDISIEQGSLIIKDMPTTSDATGFSQLLIEDSTGKLYKKI